MPFPEAKRIIYKKNPLDKVICQLRFPPVLTIDKEIPAEFQEKIRKVFPNFTESTELNIKISQDLKGAVPPEILRQMFQPSENKNYEFSSEDGIWKINLTRTFLALSANKYERWEKFKEKLLLPLDSLCEVYEPLYFSRIGLRYIDVIRRSVLNLDSVSWDELIKPYILGILASSDVKNNVNSFESKYEIKLSDQQSIVKILSKFVEAPEDAEICYMIDSDFFNMTKTNIDNTLEKLDYFSVRGSRLIQWCITERLHNAMEPEEL